MISYKNLLRHAMSLIEGLELNDDVITKIEMEEHCTTIYSEKHYYRTARIIMKNGDGITIRDDSSFDAHDKDYHSKPLLAAGKD